MLRSSIIFLAMGLLAGCGGGDESGDDTRAASSALSSTETDRLALAEVARLEQMALALPDSAENPETNVTMTAGESAAPTVRALQVTAPSPILMTFKGWDLELPVDAAEQSSGKPLTIPVASVISGASSVPTFITKYFKVVSNSLQFTASPYGALTSAAAGGARCEVKQVGASRWNPMQGTHTMQLKQNLTATPAGNYPNVVVGQVHDDENLVLIKYYGPAAAKGNASDVGTMKVEFNHGDPSGIKVLDTQYKIGTAFAITIKIVNGKATVVYDKGSASKTFSYTLKPTGGSAYFKAGVYPQRHQTGNPYTGSATVLLTSASIS